MLAGSNTLYVTSSQAVPINANILRSEICEYYKSIGNEVIRQDFGRVEVSVYGIRNSLGHEPSPAKSITFRAVPDIIRDGFEIKRNVNYENLGYKTYTFAGKAEIDGIPAYIAVIVRNTTGQNRFYVHKVFDANGNKFKLEYKEQVLNYL
ncbi:MAG: hypothetical protein LBM98_06295 [Oscillospiraceae bacterium]|nr:hypothetical protein [Oscillospiraceae bacterium]